MAKNFKFPQGKTLLPFGQIGRFQAYPKGVGMFDLRGKMVDWLPTKSMTISVLIVEMLDKVWSSFGRTPPDWTILDMEEDVNSKEDDKS